MWRSTVLSHPFQLVFPGLATNYTVHENQVDGFLVYQGTKTNQVTNDVNYNNH
jgi:hypothetical protein